jgi:methylaspartate mutase epsilon subunit
MRSLRERPPVRNERWDDDRFFAYQRALLSRYRTGAEVDMEEIADYHRRVVGDRNFPHAYRAARERGAILLQPRFGHALVDYMIAGMRDLVQEGTADLLTWSCDTYTRRLEFGVAEQAVQRSIAEGRSHLNGFPAAVYGVEATRRVAEAALRPVAGRGATGTPGFYNTIMVAGGATEFNGSALSFALNVEARQSIASAIENAQYVDRMLGWLTEHGAPVSKESSTIVSGTIVPPSSAVVCGVLEVLFAAEQGVRHHGVLYPVNSSIVQDVAAIGVMRELTRAYADRAGHEASEIAVGIHQWLGPFPPDRDRALGRISFDTVVAALARADKILVKSPEEGLGTPTKEGTIEGLKATRQVLDLMAGQELPRSPEVEEEADYIRREATAILDAIAELGDGDHAAGVVEAFDQGVVEFPFSVNENNRGRALCARDAAGAVRYLDTGSLPFDRDIVEFHRRKLRSRVEAGGGDEYELVIQDIRAELR